MTANPVESDHEPRPQVGALPFRRSADGAVSVLLVTSRESRRWVIPKGWPMKGRKPHEAARREAYEEAGLLGRIGKRPLGFYVYEKRLKNRSAVPCQVKVFPLEVRKQRKRWPEQAERDLRWVTPSEAAEMVAEPGLAAIIRSTFKRGGRGDGKGGSKGGGKGDEKGGEKPGKGRAAGEGAPGADPTEA